MNIEEIKSKITAYLKSELNVEEDFENSTKLLSLGILDSFSAISIMTFVENEFSVSVDVETVTMDNFDSVDEISNMVIKLKNE